MEAPIGAPILFQSVADGRVFIGTAAGSLACLEAGDADEESDQPLAGSSWTRKAWEG